MPTIHHAARAVVRGLGHVARAHVLEVLEEEEEPVAVHLEHGRQLLHSVHVAGTCCNALVSRRSMVIDPNPPPPFLAMRRIMKTIYSQCAREDLYDPNNRLPSDLGGTAMRVTREDLL